MAPLYTVLEKYKVLEYSSGATVGLHYICVIILCPHQKGMYIAFPGTLDNATLWLDAIVEREAVKLL